MEDYFKDMLKEDSPSLEAVVQKGVRIPGKVRKFFAGYFSLGMLLGGLGVGMARGQEKEKPINIGQAPDKATTLVYNPNDNRGSSYSLMETQLPASGRSLDFILTLPFAEPLVQVYQTMPAMPNTMQKDAKPAAEEKHSSAIWWIIGGIAAAVGGYLIYKAVTKKTPTPVPPNPDYTVTFNVFNHMLGKQKTFTRTGKAGASVSISSADWSDVANINPKYWVLRGDGFGNYVTDANDSSKTWSGTIPN